MSSRTTINDFQTALERVDQLLEKYEPKHGAAWKRQTLFTHANHGRIHAQTAETDMIHFPESDEERFGKPSLDQIEENLASNACRALMLLERFLEEKQKSGGQVGGKIRRVQKGE